MTVSTTNYRAVRITHHSAFGFEQTRARFDERIPSFDAAMSIELVIGAASWGDVQAAVGSRVGPTGLVALARLDQGALLSLSGDTLRATLYLVGNPVVAQKLTRLEPAAALYAPFRVAVYQDGTGVHVAYDKPSSVFASLGSPKIDEIALELDDKIGAAVTESAQ